MKGVRESEIDGVLCFWVDMERPATCAHLLFRQGLADEPFHERGWLHLLEHLALLDRETLTRPIEGRLTLLLTHFAAFGGPEAIVEQLGNLARWLAAPDLRLLPRERGLLQAQSSEPGDWLTRSLTWRYGANGPGVASYAEIGAGRATGPLLIERSRRVFNASNAVLVLDGSPPAGLTLPLPTGEYLPAPAALPLRRELPAAYRDEGGLTLSGVVTRTHEAEFLPLVLERALHDGLRRYSGGAYALWSSMADVDNQSAVVAGGSEVVDEMLPTLAAAALEITGQLAEDGVPREWVQEAVDHRLRLLESPAARIETALEAAYSALSDRVPLSYEELLAQLRGTDPTGVDRAAKELHASLLVGLPEAAPLTRALPAVTFPALTPQSTGRKHSHANWPAELSTFSVDDKVAERLTGGTCRLMHLKDVVALLAWRDGARHLIGRDGTFLEMEPREWVNGKELTKALDAAIPSHLQVAMGDRAATFRRMGPVARAATAFGRVANTRAGLLSLMAVVALVVIWTMVADHLVLGSVFMLVAVALGIQLWHTESGHAPSASAPPPTTVS